MPLPLYIVGGSMGIVEKTMRLNNGVIIPGIGMGTWQIPEEEAEKAVSQAIGQGYRLIDTAAIYKNEKSVGEGIKKSGIDREEIFVATKLWNEDIRQETAEEGFLSSLDKLGLAYVDLYLIHWPVPGKYIEAWKTMVKLYEEKKVRKHMSVPFGHGLHPDYGNKQCACLLYHLYIGRGRNTYSPGGGTDRDYRDF